MRYEILTHTDHTIKSLILWLIDIYGYAGSCFKYEIFTYSGASYAGEPLTYYDNHLGVTTETLHSNQKLNQFFTALSTNKGWSEVEFVSSMEGR